MYKLISFASVLHNQIQAHLIECDILCPHQSGFCAGYFTQDMLLHVMDKWMKAIDEGKYVSGLD